VAHAAHDVVEWDVLESQFAHVVQFKLVTHLVKRQQVSTALGIGSQEVLDEGSLPCFCPRLRPCSFLKFVTAFIKEPFVSHSNRAPP
jgi:hypothetical protein